MNIEERLSRLEDIVEIKKLRAKYCYRADAHDWDGFTELFTEDIHFDFGPIGVYDGQEEVRELGRKIDREHPFLAHMVHNPIIEFKDNQVTGQWYFEVPCTFKDQSAGWIQGTYLDEYRNVDGDWLFASIEADFNYFAEYDTGWSDIVTES